MFPSGQGDHGKIYVLSALSASLLYDNTPIYLTEMMGCTAALIEGLTPHSATKFESKKKTRISDGARYEWVNVIIFVIDKISFAN